mgnify:CR=1 FL=1
MSSARAPSAFKSPAYAPFTVAETAVASQPETENSAVCGASESVAAYS